MRKAAAKIVAIAVLTVIALGGCAVPEGYVPSPDIALPGSGTEALLSLPESVGLPEESSAYIYKQIINRDAMLDGASRVAGVDFHSADSLDVDAVDGSGQTLSSFQANDGSVTIENEIGHWTFSHTMTEHEEEEDFAFMINSDIIYTFPDDEALKSMAIEYVSANNIYSGEYSNIVISDTTTGMGETERVHRKSIYLFPSVNDYNVFGVFRIVIEVDHKGQIHSVYKLANNVEEYTSVVLKSRNDIAADLNEGNYSAGISSDLHDVEITSCHLAYYADTVVDKTTGDTYVYPVYVLLGNGKTDENATETFDVIIDATA
jgi:hypothetical protein